VRRKLFWIKQVVDKAMGFKELTFKLPTDFSEKQLERKIAKTLRINNFSFQIENKSLDARNKRNIHWLVRVGVSSKGLKGPDQSAEQSLEIPYQKKNKTVLVVGSGPAGFFSAFVLQKAGYSVTLIERGTDVIKRERGIRGFEKSGEFDPNSNYAFGEGGAGTFSDGKLTSRTKRISNEKKFILSSYVSAGAPAEIEYLAYPHVGSDNLKIVTQNLRQNFLDIGGRILFETQLLDLRIKQNRVASAITTNGEFQTDKVFVAPGHSAYDTYRMLIKRGVQFRTKNFAIGCRVEHPQAIINKAQWGCEKLPGVKAAEYRLTSTGTDNLAVYTFCMCPGGVVVPATAFANTNIVNGMSLYNRNAKFANAACVAAVNLERLFGRETSAVEALDWVSSLEKKFYDYSHGYSAPYCTIKNFMDQKEKAATVESSYPLGLKAAPLWEMLPLPITKSIQYGLKEFSRKINGYESGTILGLESKTSSPIQALRETNGLCVGFENLYLVGEGSGFAGGIISSGADGIKAAIALSVKDS
jgi:uncharacterized protein